MADQVNGGIGVGMTFEATPLLEFLEFKVAEVRDDGVVIEMPINEAQINLFWTAHGGALATMADVAAATSMAAVTGGAGPTVHLDIHYLTPGVGKVVRAVGRIRKASGRLVVVKVEILDGETEVATAMVTLAPVRPPRPPSE